MSTFGSQSTSLWTTTVQTPTGATFQKAIDSQYITKADFIIDYVVKGLGITASDPEYNNGALDQILTEASASINRKCGRFFNKQTIDETFSRFTLGTGQEHYYLTFQMANYPVRSINSIYFEVLGQFIQVSQTYEQDSSPDLGFFKIYPNLVSAAGTNTPIPVPTQIGDYWINYTFGYDAVPADIVRAVTLEAIKTIAMQRNVLGLVEFRSNQKTFKWGNTNAIDDQIDKLIAPYRQLTLQSAYQM